MTRKRVVRFDSTMKVVKIPTKKSNLWYTRKELKKIRIEIKVLFKSLAAGVADDNDENEFCRRGLERVAFAPKNQKAFVRSVLSMKELHKKLGLSRNHSEKALITFAQGWNKEAVSTAKMMAQQDFYIAQQIYSE